VFQRSGRLSSRRFVQNRRGCGFLRLCRSRSELLVLCSACPLEASFRDALLGTICGFDRTGARGVLVSKVTGMRIIFVVGWMDMAISG
jgi:hypothetical protein